MSHEDSDGFGELSPAHRLVTHRCARMCPASISLLWLSVAPGILRAHYRQKLGLQEVLWNLWILHHWRVCPWKVVVFLGTPWWFGGNSYCASLRLALSSIFFPWVHVFCLRFIRMLLIGFGLTQACQNDLISRAIITSAKTILHTVQFIGSRQLASLWDSHHSTCSTNCVL